MRIGINLLYLIPDVVGGTEIYARGLLSGLADLSPNEEFVVFVNRAADRWPLPSDSHFLRIICPIAGVNRVQRYFYEQLILPVLLRQYQVDLLHSLGYVGPLLAPCPTILTVHDTNFADLPKAMPFWKRISLALFSTLAAKRAAKIITDSEFSKTRISKIMRLPLEKIVVIYSAPLIDDTFHMSVDRWAEIKQLYGLNRPYIVAFGGARHKNIQVLVEAFASLQGKLEHDLVLIGRLPPEIKVAVVEKWYHLKERIIATGYIPRAHVWSLLSHADLFVFPSLYEGFGLPILEAQYSGVPVVCSFTAALPEVAGNGALFFDPRSAEDLAHIIYRVLTDTKLRREIIKKGKENVRRFSWHKAAQETLDVYYSVIRK